MIDSHMHLNQKEYDKDRPALIEKWKTAGLKAVISNSVALNTFEKGLKIRAHWPGFVFTTASIHPEYIKEVSPEQIDAHVEKIRAHADEIVGIGETGLDKFWVKEPEWQAKQKELFIRLMALARELDKPLVVHTRDAHEETVDLLEAQGVKRAHLHMWGSRGLIKRVIDNGWLISLGPLLVTSKSLQKIAKDMPLEQIMLETDSPWFGGKGADGKPLRGEPTNIRPVAEKIAEIKGLSFDEVWLQCARNAIRLYGLPVKL
jgi:TatD DNase family protein